MPHKVVHVTSALSRALRSVDTEVATRCTPACQPHGSRFRRKCAKLGLKRGPMLPV